MQYKLKAKNGIVEYEFMAGKDIVASTMTEVQAALVLAANKDKTVKDGVLYSGRYMFPIVQERENEPKKSVKKASTKKDKE